MSLSMDPTLRSLNDCGCCEGLSVLTPGKVENRPGLNAIAYRIGMHPQFKDALLARLSSSCYPALQDLTTRNNDDFSIALLDAWATVADVLTFYQERIANESFLRTATERISLLQMARLIGYELRHGVAAGTYLAFTIEDAPGAPRRATIDVGAKVQSVPGDKESPQAFETIEKIEARAEWNKIRPRLTRRQPIEDDATHLFFEGTATGLKAGDGLLLVPDDGSNPVFRLVGEVTPKAEKEWTEVRLQVLRSIKYIPRSIKGNVTASINKDKISGYSLQPSLSLSPTTKTLMNKIYNAADLNARALVKDFDIADIFINLFTLKPLPPSVLAFRTRASLFGYNAPDWKAMSEEVRSAYIKAILGSTTGTFGNLIIDHLVLTTEWLLPKDRKLDLDRVYDQIIPDSWVVVRWPYSDVIAQVQTATETGVAHYTFSSKVTRLTLKTSGDEKTKPENMDDIRKTTVFAQSEELALARLPEEEPVSGDFIELDGWVNGLSTGQLIMVCGELYEDRGNHACEPAFIHKVEHVLSTEGFTQISLTAGLKHVYVRESVTINANVARATHGETVQEVLGSGDASQSYQRFTLRQPPLTYVSADTPSGTESTLKVHVNDLLWSEVPTLYGCGPNDHVFITRNNDEGKTLVQFGDGVRGARLPTGQNNVRAVYRKGIGLGGLVRKGQLSLLMTRPLGVKEVTNPLAAEGADDPESINQARQNAPLTVLTLDRTVSLKDYEDFTRSFAGITKALATWTWDGQARIIFITVAGPNGNAIGSDSKLYKNLLSALAKSGDPHVRFRVMSYRRALFRIAGSIKVAPDHLSEKVMAAVEQALRMQFSFDARTFGQPVTLSEVIAAIQAVPGVMAVDMNKLYRVDRMAVLKSPLPEDKLYLARKTKGLAHRLLAAMPVVGADGEVNPAELLTLDPAPLDLGTM